MALVMSTPLSFENWKDLLHRDCAAKDKEGAYMALGESVLMLLWQSGLDPTVEGISDNYERQERLAS
jgi:hypothetical protein